MEADCPKQVHFKTNPSSCNRIAHSLWVRKRHHQQIQAPDSSTLHRNHLVDPVIFRRAPVEGRQSDKHFVDTTKILQQYIYQFTCHLGTVRAIAATCYSLS